MLILQQFPKIGEFQHLGLFVLLQVEQVGIC